MSPTDTRRNRQPDPGPEKTVASMIRDAIDRKGYKDVKECARAIRVPYDLFNKVVGGHIPKDAQLIEYAKKLQLDHRELLLAAYREKAPDDMKRYFNSVALLEDHDPTRREVIDILDGLMDDQAQELLAVARLIRAAPRDSSHKSTALLALYQQLQPELMAHFDSLVLLALRNDPLQGLEAFRNAVNHQKSARGGRRTRR